MMLCEPSRIPVGRGCQGGIPTPPWPARHRRYENTPFREDLRNSESAFLIANFFECTFTRFLALSVHSTGLQSNERITRRQEAQIAKATTTLHSVTRLA